MKQQFTLYICEYGIDEALEVVEYNLLQLAINKGTKALRKGKDYFIFNEYGLCVGSGRAIIGEK